MRYLSTLTVFFLLVFSYSLQAHHSFAIYDIDNKISRTGVLTKFLITNPHIQLRLEVTNGDGSKETWEIESGAPRRWETANLSRDMAIVGETVTITGWPARNGLDTMALSTITTERGTTVIMGEIEQPGVRDIVPAPTIERE